MLTILITGNPVDGFVYRGPFVDRDAAIKYAEDNYTGADWWISDLQPDDTAEINSRDQ